MKKSLLGIVSACLLAGVVQAEEPVKVKPSAPERYTVSKGDTLWGIAGRYLEDPWRWPEIWEANKQVYNPHLIFPGDVLLLCQIKDKAVLVVDQGGGCAEATARIASGGGLPETTQMADGTVKLHPKMRELPMSLAIPAIPLKDIQRYLNDSRVVTREALERAPYVIGSTDARVVAGAGDIIYVRDKNALLQPEGSYGVYRGGLTYVDPDTNEILGFEAEDIGAGSLSDLRTEVGTMKVTRTTQEIRVGDKLLENQSGPVAPIFHPSNPEGVKSGKILRVFGSIGSATQFSVIAVNRGTQDGVKPGHTFALYRRGELISDRVSQEDIRLPSERTGLAMVFRAFDRVSYALILNSTKVVKVGDEIRPPISAD
jgi:hypothetical protein